MNDTVTKKRKQASEQSKASNRLNLSLTPDLEYALSALAKRNRMPKSKIAVGLIEDALEIFEDQILAEMADDRKKQSKGKKFYSHEEAWANFK